VAWLDLVRLNKARECASWNMYPRTNPDVFDLAGVDQVTDVSLLHIHARSELLWRL
jgi:hypothetical protein